MKHPKMNRIIGKLLMGLVLLTASLYLVSGAMDDYKPYIHEPSVPEHPKLKLQGQYKTNIFPGAATYSFPVAAPKGTNGLTPEITLSYNSQTVKQAPTLVGAGWSLTKNAILRNINGSLTNTSNDEFTLVLNNVPYELVYNN